jgi:hypothetical protein
MSVESDGVMILTGENRRTRRKTCPSATLSTTNPTWIDPGANPGLRGERPATNDVSHGTALTLHIILYDTASDIATALKKSRIQETFIFCVSFNDKSEQYRESIVYT